MNMDQMAARACFMVEPLMIDLTSVPATQNPSRPRMVCTATMAVVRAATDGGLLNPPRECVMRGASAQNGNNHRRMSDTPTRRRNGDGPADSVSSVVEAPGRMMIPDSFVAPGAHAVRALEPRCAMSIGPPRTLEQDLFALSGQLGTRQGWKRSATRVPRATP